MDIAGGLQLALFVGLLVAVTKPLGLYLARVLEPEGRTWLDRPVKPVERLLYRILGVDPKSEQDWRRYARSLFVFSLAGLLFTYAVLRLQRFLPLDPQGFGPVRPDLAFNTAASFASNTDWQNYGGETTLSYFSQMVGLVFQNFVSAAAGIADVAVFGVALLGLDPRGDLVEHLVGRHATLGGTLGLQVRDLLRKAGELLLARSRPLLELLETRLAFLDGGHRRGLVVAAAVLSLCAPAAGAQEKQSDREKAAAINAELAITYMKQDNLRAAREKADKALEQNSRSPEVQMAAGFVYDRLGEDKKAGAHFEQAVKLGGKDNPDVLNNAGAFQCRKGDRKRGEELFLQAAQSPLYRTPEVAYVNAGNCARADGRPTDAERYFRQALATRPNMPTPLLQLADLQFAAGNGLQARAFLQRYHEVARASADSLWLGYRIERSLGDEAAAAELARRLKADFPTSVEAGELFKAERPNP